MDELMKFITWMKTKFMNENHNMDEIGNVKRWKVPHAWVDQMMMFHNKVEITNSWMKWPIHVFVFEIGNHESKTTFLHWFNSLNS